VPPTVSCSTSAYDEPAARHPTAVAIRGPPDDHHVDGTVGRCAVDGGLEARRDLQPLDERVLDQAHAGQLADDVHAGAAGLEELVDLGQFDAALGAAEDQLDGVDRALDGALAMPDALRSVEQRRHAVDQSEVLPSGRAAIRPAADARQGRSPGAAMWGRQLSRTASASLCLARWSSRRRRQR
jgi:hypothetical protein